jgi:hypothetical protein
MPVAGVCCLTLLVSVGFWKSDDATVVLAYSDAELAEGRNNTPTTERRKTEMRTEGWGDGRVS